MKSKIDQGHKCGCARKEFELTDQKEIIKSKFFDELSTRELYEILKARAEIFVVEQNCVYQDLDDLDYRSLHVFVKKTV